MIFFSHLFFADEVHIDEIWISNGKIASHPYIGKEGVAPMGIWTIVCRSIDIHLNLTLIFFNFSWISLIFDDSCHINQRP